MFKAKAKDRLQELLIKDCVVVFNRPKMICEVVRNDTH